MINDCTYKSVIIIWACLKTAFNRTAITDDQRYYILSQDMYDFLHTCESLLLQFPLSVSPHATMQSVDYMVSCFRYCNLPWMSRLSRKGIFDLQMSVNGC